MTTERSKINPGRLAGDTHAGPVALTALQQRVLDAVREIARRELDHSGEIEPWMSLQHDLVLDSMGLIIVAVGLEAQYQVKLNEQDAGRLSTVGDLLTLVEQRLLERGDAQ